MSEKPLEFYKSGDKLPFKFMMHGKTIAIMCDKHVGEAPWMVDVPDIGGRCLLCRLKALEAIAESARDATSAHEQQADYVLFANAYDRMKEAITALDALGEQKEGDIRPDGHNHSIDALCPQSCPVSILEKPNAD